MQLNAVAQKSVNKNSLLRTVLFCMIFFGMPIFMVGWEFGQALELREAQAREIREITMEKTLNAISRESETGIFFQRQFSHLFNYLKGQKDPKEILKILWSVKRKFPDTVDFILLDPQGDIVPGGNPLRMAGPPLKKLFQAFLKGSRIDYGFIKENWGLIRKSFGPVLKSCDIQNCVFKLASDEARKKYVFFSGLEVFGLCVVFLHHTPAWESIPLIARIGVFNRKSKDLFLGFFDENKGNLYDKRFSAAIGGLSNLPLPGLGESPQSFYHSEKGSFAQLQVLPKVRLLAFFPKKSWEIEQMRSAFFVASILLFSVMTILTWLVQSGRISLFLSIRTKLLTLFFFSAGLPLIVTLFLAWDYAQERRSLLEERILRNLEETLRQIDGRFPRVSGYIERRILNEVAQLKGSGEELQEKMIENLLEVKKNTWPATIWIANQSGDPVGVKEFPLRTSIGNSFKFARHFYINLIRIANHQELKEADLKEETVQGFAAAGGFDFQEFFAGLSQAFEEFNTVKMGEGRYSHLMAPIKDQSGIIRFMSFFNWDQDALEKVYLRFFVPRILHFSPRIFLAAEPFSEKNGKFSPNFKKYFQDGWDRSTPENPTIRYRVKRNHDTLLITVIRGSELKTCKLGALVSDIEIRKEIKSVWIKLGGICGLILLFGYAFGIGLGRLFLKPIHDLETGLQALHKRNFKERLEVSSQDELGLLLDAYNRMAEGLEDLELAKTLQENLFPGSALDKETYRLFGSCISAARIGGDYYDYRMLSEDRIGFLIGDVSGHGSGAAMVVSIVKGVISLPQISWDPAELCTKLNILLFNTVKRKKMMTLLIGFIDIPTRKMVFCNAGHIGPYIVRKEKTISLQGESWVLGIRTKAKYKNEEADLEPNDTIIFITDGISEAQNPAGQQIGYEILEKTFPTLVADTPEETESRIRDWHKTVVRDDIQEDDMTLLIIKG